MNVFQLSLFSVAVLASLACTLLLLRGYLRGGERLLFWSALCFVGLSINNLLLFVDLVIFPIEIDLRPHRLLAALAGLLCLLYGFIWEAE
jgi:hypothetical protein